MFRAFVFLCLLLGTQMPSSFAAAEAGALDLVRFYGSGFVSSLIPESFTNVVGLARSANGIVVLRDDGTLSEWAPSYSSLPPGLSNVAAIAAGDMQSIALFSNGTVRVWGGNPGPVPFNPKLKKIRAIAAGGQVGLALRADGRIVGWGDNSFQQLTVPRKKIRRALAIACGDAHALALTRKGTVVAWGNNTYGQAAVPVGLQGVKAISAGRYCSAALLTNGTVVVWGDPNTGQTNVPSNLTNVMAIVVGPHHCLALKGDGTVVGWGVSDILGTPLVPADLTHVTGMLATTYESFFITKGVAAHIVSSDSFVYAGQPAHFEIRAVSQSPVRYRWSHDGVEIPGATNALYEIQSTTLSDGGTYTALAQNDFSSRLLTMPPLAVQTPSVHVFPTNAVAKYGDSVTFFASISAVEVTSIRWSLNGDLIPGGAEGLLRVNVTPTNGGIYQAVVQINSSNTITSNPARLTVLPGWSVQPATWFEGNGSNVQFIPLTAHAPFPTNVTLQYSVSGSAHVPAASGQITLPAGSTNGFIPVQVAGDAIRQPNENFEVTLNPADLNVALWRATVTVQNNDAFPLLTATPQLLGEGNGAHIASAATLQLSAPATNAITVHFETHDLTAIAGQDYLGTNGFITIVPGQSTASVPIIVLGNLLLNPSKTFELTLSDATNAFFMNVTFTITIDNDDTLVIPLGFTVSLVATGLNAPTAFAVLEDRILACEQYAGVVEMSGGQKRTLVELNLHVGDLGSELGALGLVVDPGFVSNGFFYVYYTHTAGFGADSRVSRFTYATNGTVTGSEQVLLELGAGGIHNAGGLKFGPDGKLYISAGENGVPANAQTLTNLQGKILRLNSDGTIPSDNPFYFTASGKNRAIWAYGLRNPWRFDFEPVTGRMFINDVGEATWEEINEGFAGANYGWPWAEGFSAQAGLMNPLFVYGHSASQCAITGGAFVGPNNGAFPAEFSSDYFVADYCGDFIRRFNRTNLSVENFATGLPYVVDLQIGPDGALYCATHGGAIYRFSKTP
jgi:glucose/arabinose dehydrogenase